MNKVLFLLFFLGFGISANAQRISQQEYIKKYKDIAIREMFRTGVPASIKLAQGLLESESGNGDLCKRSFNHFGIKCKSTWQGESVYHDDDEKGECFRKYNNVEESYRDHSNFLRGSERYASLFNLSPTDYKGWAYGLKKAGYATNPKYPQILLYQIEKFNLHEFDLVKDTENLETLAVEDLNVEVKEPEFKNNQDQPFDYKVKTKRNGIVAVFAPAGTSTLAIAIYHNIALSRLLENNDMDNDGILKSDSWIYLDRKNKESNQSTYIVEEGETMFDVSQRQGVQLQKLAEYNNLEKKSPIKKGDVIKLKPNVENANIIYEVLPSEGLYAISKKFNVSINKIKELNRLESDNLQVGQKLIISK
ncbi:MAG: glucosaminidase domain-containing protein [Ferruginibacter sp.]